MSALLQASRRSSACGCIGIADSMSRAYASFLGLLFAMVPLTPLFAAEQAALSNAEPVGTLANDRAQWAGVKTVDQKYQPAPADWTHTINTDARVEIAFPCKPEREVTSLSGGINAFLYLCNSAKRVYVVTVQPMDFPDDQTDRDNICVAAHGGIRDVAGKTGDTVSFAPTMRVTFSGMVGRQEHIHDGKYVMEQRTLFGQHFAITMSAEGRLANMPGDTAQFFNALRVIGLEQGKAATSEPVRRQ